MFWRIHFISAAQILNFDNWDSLASAYKIVCGSYNSGIQKGLWRLNCSNLAGEKANPLCTPTQCVSPKLSLLFILSFQDYSKIWTLKWWMFLSRALPGWFYFGWFFCFSFKKMPTSSSIQDVHSRKEQNCLIVISSLFLQLSRHVGLKLLGVTYL